MRLLPSICGTVSSVVNSSSRGFTRSGQRRKADFSWLPVRFASRLAVRYGSHRNAETGRSMKTGLRNILLVGLCAAAAVSARGEDLTTSTGKTYHEIQVLSRNSSDLLIQSREGEFQVPLSELKPADRERFSKDLTKAIELPAMTVIGEQKVDFTASPERSRSETFALKEILRQEDQNLQAHKKRVESYQPVQIFKGVTFSLGTTDPKNDLTMLPDYMNLEYGHQSPEVVEKDLKIFRQSLNNPSP